MNKIDVFIIIFNVEIKDEMIRKIKSIHLRKNLLVKINVLRIMHNNILLNIIKYKITLILTLP